MLPPPEKFVSYKSSRGHDHVGRNKMENLQPDVPPLTREPFFVAAKQGDHFGRRFSHLFS